MQNNYTIPNWKTVPHKWQKLIILLVDFLFHVGKESKNKILMALRNLGRKALIFFSLPLNPFDHQSKHLPISNLKTALFIHIFSEKPNNSLQIP